MNTKLFDTLAVVLAIMLIPLVGASLWAFLNGQVTFKEYADLWATPIALVLGFYLKGRQQDAGQ